MSSWNIFRKSASKNLTSETPTPSIPLRRSVQQLDQQPEPYLGFAPEERARYGGVMSEMDLTDCEVIVPPAYQILARELKPVLAKLRDGFVKRPAPAGLPYTDIEQALSDNWERLSNCPGAMTASVNNMGKVVSQADATDYAISQVVGKVGKEVDELISAYHDMWCRPFPDGLEKGQILISAVFERMLRTLLDSFEQIVMVVQEPREAVVRYGTSTINLATVFQADEEIAEFNSWLNSIRSEQVRLSVPSAGLGTLAASFFLGWWIGRDE